MTIETPAAYGILDFVLSHSALHTVNKLAQLAGVPGSNIRAGLQGKRPIPLPQVAKLAAVAGLQLQISEQEDVSLVLEGNTVLHLSVNLNELGTLTTVAGALSARQPDWKFVQAQAEGGTYLTALAYVQAGRYSRRQHGYIAAHVSDLLLGPAQACVQEQLAGKKPLPEPFLAVDDAQWIRLRAGLQSAAEMDALYKVGQEPEPTAMDWARVFMLASQLGQGPEDIVQAMRDRHQAGLVDMT